MMYDVDEAVPVPKRTLVRRKNTGEGQGPSTPSPTSTLLDLQSTYDLSPDQHEVNWHRESQSTSQREKRLAILSYINRMKLSGTASEFLIDLLKLLGENESLENCKSLKAGFVEADVMFHDYCAKCERPFPADTDTFVCATDGCNELRFDGTVNEQYQKKRKSYFASVSLASQLTEIAQRCKLFEGSDKSVTLTMNTDGVPLYNSSSVSLWPVFCSINELPPAERFLTQNLVIWGLWQGKGKPNFKTYLQPLVDELNKLQEGVIVGQHEVKAILTCCTMDLQAKAQVMEMSPHNGQYACITCEVQGSVFEQGKGHCKAFPFETDIPKRTVESILNNAENNLNNSSTTSHVKGIKGVSVLLGIDNFDPVSSLVPEYMHGVLLGTAKKLLTLWFKKSSSKEPFYLGRCVADIDRRLINIKPTDHMSRLPRKIDNTVSHWKASELQHWLLFYSVPCLDGFLPGPYMDNLCYLVQGIYLLLGEQLTEAELEQAELTLLKFQLSFEKLYGAKHCGLNIHNIGCHLVEYARKHGPLWAWSCFPFEDLNGILVKSAHGTGNVCYQLLTTMLAHRQVFKEVDLMEDQELKSFTQQMLKKGQHVKEFAPTSSCRIAKCTSVSDKELTRNIEDFTELDNIDIQKVERIRLSNGQLITSTHYRKMKKRICYAVSTQNDLYYTINFFVFIKAINKVVAIGQELVCVGPVHREVDHLMKVVLVEKETMFYVDNIKEKILLISIGSDMCIGTIPNCLRICK